MEQGPGAHRRLGPLAGGGFADGEQRPGGKRCPGI